MSSGSYFTLYRKYTTCKISSDELNKLIKMYVDENKNKLFGENRTEKEISKDIPIILNPFFETKKSICDKTVDKNDRSIISQRNMFNKILAKDGSYLDELLVWYFNSSFTCLKNEWNMNSYQWSNSKKIIDIPMAEFMLQGCNYLLNGNWSDEFERILNNKWINIFAKGDDINSYWKYIFRNDKKSLKEIDNENNEEIEIQLSQVKNALETFLTSEVNNPYYNCPTELMLVYTVY